MTDAELPTLIPRRVLFGNPTRASPRLSPDGRRFSYLAEREGVLNVFVGPSDNPAAAQPVTDDRDRGVRIYFWAYTSQHILYLQDKGGDENWRVYVVDLESGASRDLTPFDGVQARIDAVSADLPDEILISLNNRQPELHDLYRVNIRTGERTLLYENEGFVSFLCDEQFTLRLGAVMNPDGGIDYLRRAADGWTPFINVGPDDALTTAPLAYDQTGRRLYVIDSRDRDTAALYEVALNDAGEQIEQRLLIADDRADISDTTSDPQSHIVQAAASSYDRKLWRTIDAALEPDFAYLATVARGEIDILSRTRDDSAWIVAYTRDDGPVSYYRYERQSERTAAFLFSNRAALEDAPLTQMQPHVIPARDGLELVSYLSLPQPDAGQAKPPQPLPMVLLVHGGPWARDAWGYQPEHQWLANRGYAVLSVNFRGSTGFGKAFLNAANRQWSAKMHDDLLDAVNWAIERHIADPAKIAIMGGSYGGYATLVGLTFTPDVFACGVDIVGVSNLVTLLESVPDYWKPMLDMFTTRVGDHRTDEGRAFLNACSPLSKVDQITKPLLIAQGANDPRVKRAESDQIVAAMQQRNIPVTYVLYPDEGHGFARPENNLSFYVVAEAFLAEHLGGRFEPPAGEFSGSSIEVLAGEERIPGLRE